MKPNHFTNELENVTADFALLVYAVGQRMNPVYIKAVYDKLYEVNAIVQSNDMSVQSGWERILRAFIQFQSNMNLQAENVELYTGLEKDWKRCIQLIIHQIRIAFLIDFNVARRIANITDRVVYMLKILKTIGIYFKRSIVTYSATSFEFKPFLSDEAVKQAFLLMIDRLINTGAIIVNLSSNPLMSQNDTLWKAVGQLANLIDK